MTIEEININGKTVSIFENHKLAPFVKDTVMEGLEHVISAGSWFIQTGNSVGPTKD